MVDTQPFTDEIGRLNQEINDLIEAGAKRYNDGYTEALKDMGQMFAAFKELRPIIIAAYNEGFKDAKDDACGMRPDDDDTTMAVFRGEYLTRIGL